MSKKVKKTKVPKSKSKPLSKTVYIVKYNDRYGNGDQTSIEAIIEKESHFKKWLKMHNDGRKMQGEQKENAEEFDVDSVEMVIF
jgi:hypothetical protein